MTKKLLFAGFLTMTLATLALIAEPVSADYYDCNGNLKSGDPSPSECHYFLTHQRTTSSSIGRNKVNIVTKIGKNYSDLEEARNSEDAIIVDDPDTYSKEYEVRNARKYCIRDYCYIVYDYCYDLTHCEQKVDRIPRDEYENSDDWKNMFEDYLNDYFKRNPNGNCGPQTGKCVYRGFYFGGSHNGYWYY